MCHRGRLRSYVRAEQRLAGVTWIAMHHEFLEFTMRSLLLLFLGFPIPIIILIALFFR